MSASLSDLPDPFLSRQPDGGHLPDPGGQVLALWRSGVLAGRWFWSRQALHPNSTHVQRGTSHHGEGSRLMP